MAKLRGSGIAAVSYPTGVHLGGDPTQALVHVTTSGGFVVTMASVDLGQGLKTVLAQIAAETLGVPLETVIVDTGDTDTGPHCGGSGASRATHRAGNAVIMAAEEARRELLDVASEKLEVNAEDLVTDGAGNIHVKGVKEKSITVGEAAGAAQFELGRAIAGRGIFLVPPGSQDPETGEGDPFDTQAHACAVAEVEIDTETGEVEVLSLKIATEVGRQINPALVRGQIMGGAWMGLSHALYETTAPYYPTTDSAPGDFNNYLMPGAAEMPETVLEVLEHPSESGPFGVKGIGEMVVNSPIPAIVSAINDALDVEITEIPVTPEVILHALDEKAAGGGAA